MQSINLDVLTRYYNYYYVPLCPHSLSSLDMDRCQDKLYGSNQREGDTLEGEVKAVLKLARERNDFVVSMALLVAALDITLGKGRAEKLLRVLFNIRKEDLLSKMDCMAPLQDLMPQYDGSPPDFLWDQAGDSVFCSSGRFDAKTVVGMKLADDLALWRIVASSIGLVSLERNEEVSESPTSAQNGYCNSESETMTDVRIVCFLVTVMRLYDRSRESVPGLGSTRGNDKRVVVDENDKDATGGPQGAILRAQIMNDTSYQVLRVRKTSVLAKLARTLMKFGFARGRLMDIREAQDQVLKQAQDEAERSIEVHDDRS